MTDPGSLAQPCREGFLHRPLDLFGRIGAEKKQDFVALMERETTQHGYDMMLLMLTDVLKEGTLLIAVGDLDSVEHAFNVSFRDHAVFLPGVISRKKQIVPALSLLWG